MFTLPPPLASAAGPAAAAAAAAVQGFRGRGGTTTQRLDGAIYAASNAALMLAQLGEEEGALKEVSHKPQPSYLLDCGG
jgi:hypothetical protein